MTQFNKTSERLDKVEKAQVEPAAKLARLSEAVEKLHATPPGAGSRGSAAAWRRKPPARFRRRATRSRQLRPRSKWPGCRRWKAGSLRDVANGGALIEGRQGIYEVYAGDPVPGLGRIDAIRRQDGRWVVVTSKGLIVAR